MVVKVEKKHFNRMRKTYFKAVIHGFLYWLIWYMGLYINNFLWNLDKNDLIFNLIMIQVFLWKFLFYMNVFYMFIEWIRLYMDYYGITDERELVKGVLFLILFLILIEIPVMLFN